MIGGERSPGSPGRGKGTNTQMQAQMYVKTRKVQNVSSWVEDGVRWYNWNEVVLPRLKVETNSAGVDSLSLGSPTSIYSPRSRKAVKRFAAHKQKHAYLIPFLTIGIIATFFYQMLEAGWELEDFQVNPWVGPTVQNLVDLGARRGDLVVTDGEWWRLFSSTFIHAGFIQLAVSCCGLAILGEEMEREYGWWRVLLIFMMGAIGGACAGLIFVPEGIAVGANAGMMALCGAELGGLLINWDLEPAPLEESIAMLLWIGLILGVGILPLLDNWASAFGTGLGLLLGIALFARKLQSSSRRRASEALDDFNPWKLATRILCGLIGFTIFAVACAMLFTRVNGDWCGETCHNFTCLEMPPNVDREAKWWYCDACRLYGIEYTYRADGSGFVVCPDGKTEKFFNEPPLNDERSLVMCENLCTNFGFGYEARDISDAITFVLD